MFVTMMTTQTPCSHTVRQKSPNVLATGPNMQKKIQKKSLVDVVSKQRRKKSLSQVEKESLVDVVSKQ